MDRRLKLAIAQVPGWHGISREMTPLNGGITNQNFKIETADGAFVLKLDGKRTHVLGIDRSHEWTCGSIAAGLGIGPELYHFMPGSRSLVTRFIEGDPVSRAAAGQPTMLRRIVASIKRLHSGPAFPGRFSPFQTVRDYYRSCRGKNLHQLSPRLPDVFERMKRIETALGRRYALRPCHNDLLASNLIDDGETIRLLDWEYAAMGDPFFDLGNFAANQRLSQKLCRLLLTEYCGEARPEALARLNLHRLSSELREAFWGFLQSSLSSLEFDFMDYGTKRLERFLREARGPQFEGWISEVARK